MNQLSAWWAHENGVRTQRQLEIAMRDALRDCFGYYLLQIGHHAPALDYRAISSIKHQFLQYPTLSGKPNEGLFVADAAQIPVLSDSVDCVVLIQTLDFAADPHQILREIDRILIPEGVVIIVGFNPWYMLGIPRIFQRFRRDCRCGEQRIAVNRLHDWLALLGFDVTRLGMFGAASGSYKALKIPRMPVSVAGVPYPIKGPLYIVKAVKRISTLTPIMPSWRRQKSRIGVSVVEPAARTSNQAKHACSGIYLRGEMRV